MTFFGGYYRSVPWLMSSFLFLAGIFEKRPMHFWAMFVSAAILLAAGCVVEAIHRSKEVP